LKGAPFLFSREEGVQTHLKEDGREKKIGGKNFTDMARFFLVQHTKREKYTKRLQNIPIDNKIYHKYSQQNLSNGHKICQHFQNLPKLGFLV
jgi:hypothetical protein